MVKRILCLALVIMMLLTCVGCGSIPKEENGEKESVFVCVEEGSLAGGYHYTIVYHKDTKVMYSMSHYGEATVMVDAEGKPLLWEG